MCTRGRQANTRHLNKYSGVNSSKIYQTKEIQFENFFILVEYYLCSHLHILINILKLIHLSQIWWIIGGCRDSDTGCSRVVQTLGCSIILVETLVMDSRIR